MKTGQGILLVILLGLPWVAPLVAPADPMKTHAEAAIQPPSAMHLMGTDSLGRDVLARLLYGGQRSLIIAVIGVITASSLGLGLGLAASTPVMGSVTVVLLNALLALPQILFGFVVLTLLGSNAVSLAVAVGSAQIASYAWIVYRAILQEQHQTHVEAAKALGASPFHILLVHILPGIQPTLMAYTGVVFSYCLLNSAAFSALGLGGELGVPDWGVMLAEGRAVFRSAPWVSVAPGLAILMTVSTVNALADQLSHRANR
jgi:peptide/nickel transport system permease protein